MGSLFSASQDWKVDAGALPVLRLSTRATLTAMTAVVTPARPTARPVQKSGGFFPSVCAAAAAAAAFSADARMGAFGSPAKAGVAISAAISSEDTSFMSTLLLRAHVNAQGEWRSGELAGW